MEITKKIYLKTLKSVLGRSIYHYFCKNETLLKCSCKTYALFDGICSHILGVAEKRGELKSVLDKQSATGRNSNKTVSQAEPKRAGEKCHKNPPTKAKNNVKMQPLTDVFQLDVLGYDPELDKQKLTVFSKYWHNGEDFYVHLIDEKD